MQTKMYGVMQIFVKTLTDDTVSHALFKQLINAAFVCKFSYNRDHCMSTVLK